MRLKRKAATKDHWSANNSKRAVARLRAYFAAFLALGATGLLVSSVARGRFEKMRHFGTITYAENPFGFMAMTTVWAVGVAFFFWVFLHFWDESRR